MQLPRRSAVEGIVRACAEALEDRLLLSAALFKDINTGTDGSSATVIASTGNLVYFAAGSSVYQTDGTDAGTDPVRPAWGGVSGEPFSTFQLAPDKIVAVYQNQLWETAGSLADATLLATLPSAPTAVTVAGGKLFFVENYQLWASDGTEIHQVAAAAGVVSPPSPVGDKVLFATMDFSGTPSNDRLYISDGTAAGTAVLAGPVAGGNAQVITAGSKAYFVTQSAGIWQTDGTPAGTSAVTSISVSGLGDVLTAPSGLLLFDDPSAALYATDGSSTRLVGSVSLAGSNAAFVGGRLVFAGNSGQQSGIWSTDGTPAGTQFVKAVDNYGMQSLTQAGGAALFRYNDGTHGTEWWKTDGTVQGTTLLKDINPHGDGLPAMVIGYATPVQHIGSEAFFAADDGVHGRELWKSDGTDAGTMMVKDITTTPASSSPHGFTDVNGTLYFTATDDHGTQPWTSDGTPAGTHRLDVVTTETSLDAQQVVPLGDKTMLFNSTQAWVTDWTEAGTSKLMDSAAVGYIALIAASGNQIFFIVNAPNNTAILWKTDGTVAGTKMLKTIPGVGTAIRPVDGGGVEFLLNGIDLWTSDGTSAGTTAVVAPLDLGVPSPSAVSPLPDVLFVNSDYYVGIVVSSLNQPARFTPKYQLWRIGPSGSTKVFETDTYPTAVDAGPTSVNGRVLIVVNGTLCGLDTATGDASPLISPQQGVPYVTVSGSLGYFVTYSSSPSQTQVWATDGTAAGTRAIASFPGSDGAGEFSQGPGLVAFVVGSPSNDDVWISDGTAQGTRDLASFAPNPLQNDSVVGDLTFFGGRLLFNAWDAAHGFELWSADISGSVSGSVFNDANHNAAQDPGEGPLAGVIVYADTNNNGTLDPGEPNTITASDGSYTLSGVAPGSALVREVPLPGWRRTTVVAPVVVRPLVAGAGPVFGDVQVSTVAMNFDYLLTLAQHYGQAGTFATGDVTGDDTVTFDDLLLVAQNYGHALSTGTASVAAEDDSLLLKRSRAAR